MSLPAGPRYQARFRLAAVALVSSLALCLSLAFRRGFAALSDVIAREADSGVRARAALGLVQIAAAFCAHLALAGIPRRPDVYDRGHLVEQRYTVSLLSLASFSWDHLIFDIARARQVQTDDIPVPDAKGRSRNLHARFLAASGPRRRPLWRQLLFVYRRELAHQWLLTLIISCLSIFPQIVMYNFLSRLESLDDFSTADVSLLVWTLGLLLTQFLVVMFTNRLKWVSASELEISVGAMLQSLVFAKALRHHEDSSAPASAEDDDEGGGGVRSRKDKERPDKKSKKKSKKKKLRQSVMNHMKLDR